ncbi:MAG TPA: hypothetical protein VFU43_03555 [Streptosporangiaceae bacterium]|nr:hypothetical protein [Streptosporangiaceae bacterium]
MARNALTSLAVRTAHRQKSRRTLELPQRAAEASRNHHTHQAEQKLKAGMT